MFYHVLILTFNKVQGSNFPDIEVPSFRMLKEISHCDYRTIDIVSPFSVFCKNRTNNNLNGYVINKQ